MTYNSKVNLVRYIGKVKRHYIKLHSDLLHNGVIKFNSIHLFLGLVQLLASIWAELGSTQLKLVLVIIS